MMSIPFRILYITLLVISVNTLSYSQNQVPENINFNQLSETLLKNIKDGKDTKTIQETLSKASLVALEHGLQTDHKKLAFWINIYNAYIQIILSKHPELYKDRAAFFKEKQIYIAGKLLSFDKIEHGIIRKSQWKLGLGYIRKVLPNKFERKLRVDKRDYRVHFALNCGAKDCPPVAIYQAEQLDEQLNQSMNSYLKKVSIFDEQNHSVATSPLFSWFRGDFGCKKNIKNILKSDDIIPTTKNIDLTYKTYDWTLDLGNWVTL